MLRTLSISFAILSLLITYCITNCHGADGILYKDALVICKVKKVSENGLSYTKLDLPFQVFGQNIVCKGKDVTYSLDKLADGAEVMAKVDFKAEDEDMVKAYGTIDKKSQKYAEHYPYTKAETLATFNPITEEKILYKGADKDERADFCARCV